MNNSEINHRGINFRSVVEFRDSQIKEGNGTGNKAYELGSLKFYMEFYGMTFESDIGDYLGESTVLEGYLAKMTSRGLVAATTLATYKSRIRNWSQYAQILIANSGAEHLLVQEIVANALSQLMLIEGCTKSSVAARCGMTLQQFMSWYQPGLSILTRNEKNEQRATALEKLFGLPKGLLIDKLSKTTSEFFPSREDVKKAIQAKSVLIPLSQVPYFPESLPERIENFIVKLTLWKTTKTIVTRLDGEAIEKRDDTKAEKGWTRRRSDGVCSAADLMRIHLSSFYGWMMLPASINAASEYVCKHYRGKAKVLTEDEMTRLAPMFVGKGLKPNDLMIAHLTDPELQTEFVNWRESRGLVDEFGLVQNIIAILNPNNGFLSQQVEYVWDYPSYHLEKSDTTKPSWQAGYRKTAKKWKKKCVKLIKLLSSLQQNMSDRKERVQKKLQPILDQEDLIGVLLKTIERHGETKPMATLNPKSVGSPSLALWWRDQLLLKMLTSNPLRNRNYREMSYTSDNGGNLYQKPDKQWWIRFAPSDFKNQKGAAKNSYDVPLPKTIVNVLETYLFQARPLLEKEGKKSDKVFLSRNGIPFGQHHLSTALAWLTGRFMPENIDVQGIRTHAFRHIVATAWLRAHPEDYLTVAFILHDTLHTVINNYSHLKASDGLKRYNTWLSAKENERRV